MDNQKPYKVGVALSGGGARGFAHAGALRAIEEAGLKPDIIAGVSAGSVIAVMYAAGINPEQMVDVFNDSSFSRLAEFKLNASGFFTISRFTKLILNTIKPYKNLEDLPLPTIIGATDFDNGTEAWFDHGAIGPRMAASCSIPVIFQPQTIDGVRYVDGGLVHNLPSAALRDKCELLIGIDVSPTRTGKHDKGITDVAMRTYNIVARCNQHPDRDMCDLLIEMLPIANYKVFNLKQIQAVYTSGYATARHALRQAGLWQNSN